MFTISISFALCALGQLMLVSGYPADPPKFDPGPPLGTCAEWTLATYDDTCKGIASGGSITVDQLISFNRSLKKECVIEGHVFYCIAQNSAPRHPTVFKRDPSTTTASKNKVTTPLPILEGMVDSCITFYKVVGGDTCLATAKKHGISLEIFYSWNPAVGEDCSKLVLDSHVCVGINSQNTRTPTTSTQPTDTKPTNTKPADTEPTNTKPTNTKPADTEPTNTKSTNIEPTHTEPTHTEPTNTKPTNTKPTTTQTVTTKATTTKTVTTRSINSVTTPTPTQGGMVADCDKFYLVKEGDGCHDIAAKSGISLDSFYSWNPDVGHECLDLLSNYHVCVHRVGEPTKTTDGDSVVTPTPTLSGMVVNCDTFHKVVFGDGCDSVAANAGVSVDQFVSWNPAVGAGCTSLWLGYHVCIGLV